MDPDIKDDCPKTQREILREIIDRVDTMPHGDHRSEEEILGYDEHGIPR